jgi:hypothetical protein
MINMFCEWAEYYLPKVNKLNTPNSAYYKRKTNLRAIDPRTKTGEFEITIDLYIAP